MITFTNIIEEGFKPKISWKSFYASLEVAGEQSGKWVYPSKKTGDNVGDFVFDSKKEAVEAFHKCVTLFNTLPDPLPIYRFVYVNDISEINIKAPGTHWTWCTTNWSSLHDVFEGRGDHLILLSGVIAKQYVDWETTVQYYCEHCLYEAEDDAENEIYIPEENAIHIESLTWKEYK